jgi:hypothetical protein
MDALARTYTLARIDMQPYRDPCLRCSNNLSPSIVHLHPCFNISCWPPLHSPCSHKTSHQHHDTYSASNTHPPRSPSCSPYLSSYFSEFLLTCFLTIPSRSTSPLDFYSRGCPPSGDDRVAIVHPSTAHSSMTNTDTTFKETAIISTSYPVALTDPSFAFSGPKIWELPGHLDSVSYVDGTLTTYHKM